MACFRRGAPTQAGAPRGNKINEAWRWDHFTCIIRLLRAETGANVH